MSCVPIEGDQIDALERINAMRSQEENTERCRNYFTSVVDASCRKAIVDWCFVVADAFDLGRETVAIAMSLLDRYLSSGGGESAEALRSQSKFQLAAITSFYISVKIHGPIQLGIEMLARKLCRGVYKKSAIAAMERDILCSLEWRVCVSTTTPMEHVRQFLQLLPEPTDIADVILENATKHIDCATSDFTFSTCRPSTVGIASLAGAINDTHTLSSMEKEFLWSQLSAKLDVDVASNEVRKVEQQLLARSIRSEPRRQSRASLPRTHANSANEELSSPVSVVKMGGE